MADTTAVAPAVSTVKPQLAGRTGGTGGGSRGSRNVTSGGRGSRYALRFVALAYLALILILPVGLIIYRTFSSGLGEVFDALGTEDALHAFRLTVEVAVVAVVANTIFGVGAALLLVRHRFPGRRLLNAFIDLPLAVSPVVVGLALILVYGSFEPVGRFLGDEVGIQIIFSVPGMVLATIFVSLPLVVRAVAPVLEEVGVEQEQAAWTLGAGPVQTFLRVTLPSIRGALAYGVVLALARALGEYGALAVVSGRLQGKTQTLTLFVQDSYENYEQVAAYAASFVLALLAVLTLVIARFLRPKDETR
ncbi:MAG: sulfate/thiosulfate transport system permease protein [Frankiaceae bacterium]|nr:sulfate/thiosulfate transport system permease protein [Frankiaceae bacterium]